MDLAMWVITMSLYFENITNYTKFLYFDNCTNYITWVNKKKVYYSLSKKIQPLLH